MTEVRLTVSTPIFDKIRQKGATFYTFSPALNDLDRQRMNQGIVVSPAKFVCVKLPNWQNPGDVQNFQTIFVDPSSMQGTGGPVTDPNICFPKVMQNYMENLLQYAYSEKIDGTLSTVAEIAFWKMLKHTGALQVIKTGEEFIINGKPYEIYKEREFEKNPSGTVLYDPVVKYIGDINILNNVDKDGQVYTEIMMYIPTNSGKTTGVQFVDSLPKFAHNTIPITYAEGSEDGVWSVGLEDHKNDLSKAVYDDSLQRKYELGSDYQRLGLWFDSESIEQSSEEFEFNAILVYYDVWNSQDPSTKVTNLFGILFMNDMVEDSAGIGRWQNYEKLVNDKNGAGNSYVFRLNLKNTNHGTQVDSEVTVNDYDTVSMALYLEAIKKLNDCNTLYQSLHEQFVALTEKSNAILSAAALIGNSQSLVSRVATLERLVTLGVNENQISAEEMMEMLRTTNQTIVANPQSVVVFNKMTGNPVVREELQPDGSIKLFTYVIDPRGETWMWDEASLSWILKSE